MKNVKFTADRSILSTDNNEYAEGFRDENLVEENLVNIDIPIDEMIPEGVEETGTHRRPQYNEEGYEHEPGQ